MHQLSDKAWTTDDADVVGTLVGDKRSSLFGVLIAADSAHSVFDFLSASSGAREQVPVPRESLLERRELSQHSLSNSQGLQPPLKPHRPGLLWGEISYVSHTHQVSTFHQYQLLGQQSSQEWRETCIYYSVSAP